MKNLKIRTTEYTYLSNALFPQYYGDITRAIISQPEVFSNLPIEPQTLIDAGKAMKNTTDRANRGSEVDKTTRNSQRVICEAYLNQLGNCILARASMESTEEKQLWVVSLSKFTPVKLTRTRASLSDSPQVTGVSAKPTGKAGEIMVKWNRIRSGVLVYEVQWAFTTSPNEKTQWHSAGITSRCKITIDGIKQYTPFFVRVIARGYGTAATVPSDAIMCVAL